MTFGSAHAEKTDTTHHRRQLQSLYEGEGLFELGELRFFGFEFAGVNAAAEATHLDGMLEMKHLVIEQILDCIAGT